jgi:hypothetical protein
MYLEVFTEGVHCSHHPRTGKLGLSWSIIEIRGMPTPGGLVCMPFLVSRTRPYRTLDLELELGSS